MENNQEVTAQNFIHGHSGLKNRNPLVKTNIGDKDILWNASQGAPWDVDPDADYDGSATYLDHNVGIRLTDAIQSQYGEAYWYREFDLTKDIYVKGTFLSGLGTGGDLCGLYLCGVSVYFNEYAGNVVVVETSEFTSDEYYVADVLDDVTWRTFEVIYEYKKSDVRYVTVLVDGKHICRVNVGGGYNTYPFAGVFAYTGASTNTHYCKSFEVRSAIPWLTVYQPIIRNKKDKIYILINDTYVDYVLDPMGGSEHEANNLIALFDDNSIAYQTFTDISESGWTTVNSTAGYILIPEIEHDDILPDLTSGAKNKINSFVNSGGKLVMFNPGNGDVVQFLNDIFSFSIIDSGAYEPINITVAGSALFPSESSTLPSLSATSSLDISTLPPDSVVIYEGSGTNQSVVTKIPYGSGKIYVMGWDWYDAAPLGVEDGGWLHLLESILQS